MIGMVHIEFIKKKHRQKGLSIRRIVVIFVSTGTVRKAMAEAPLYRLTKNRIIFGFSRGKRTLNQEVSYVRSSNALINLRYS
jgi:hypothetical protein